MADRWLGSEMLGRLVAAHPRITGANDRLRARLFSILTLVHVTAVMLILPIMNFWWARQSGHSIWRDLDALVIMAALVLILGAYALLHWGFYRAGMLSYILVTMAVPLIAPFVPDPNAEIGLLATAMIPILLASIVLSPRWVLGIIAATIGISAIQLTLAGMPPRQKGTGFALLIAVAVTGCLILVFRQHLAALEQQRLCQIQESEEAVRRSTEKYRQLFEAVTDGIMIASPQGKLLEVNESACRQLGYARAELLNLPLAAISARGPADVAATLQTVQRRGHAFYQTSHICKDGSTLPVELSITAVEFNGEKAYLGVVRDLTERRKEEEDKRQLEARLQQAGKMESMGVLAGGVAHDFNNLLTSILGNTELALMDVPADSPPAEMLRDIQRAGQSAASLTRQLLAFSRKQMIVPRALNLNELIGQMHKMLSRLIGEDVDLKIIEEENLAPIMADPGLVEQIIVNLAANARDAMPEGGTLIIETANARLDQDSLHLHPELKQGEFVALTVTDTGVGMSPEVKAKIFEPFFTTKPKGRGTGLGLATTYGAVQQSGGHIQVYSELGEGTTFRVYLPQASMQPANQAPKEEHIPHGHETILVVEDEEEVRNLARRILLQLGYEVITAGSGEEALQAAQRHQGPIHLLLSDVVMPGLSGPQLAEQFAVLHPQARLLFTSGYTEDVIILRGVLEDGSSFLTKPYTPRSLGTKVREILAPGGGPPQT